MIANRYRLLTRIGTLNRSFNFCSASKQKNQDGTEMLRGKKPRNSVENIHESTAKEVNQSLKEKTPNLGNNTDSNMQKDEPTRGDWNNYFVKETNQDKVNLNTGSAEEKAWMGTGNEENIKKKMKETIKNK